MPKLRSDVRSILINPINKAIFGSNNALYAKVVSNAELTAAEIKQLTDASIKVASNPPGSIKAQKPPKKVVKTTPSKPGGVTTNQSGRGKITPSKPGGVTTNADGRGSALKEARGKVGANVVSPTSLPVENNYAIDEPVDDSFFASDNDAMFSETLTTKPTLWDKIKEKPVPYIAGTVGGLSLITGAVIFIRKRNKKKSKK